MKTKILFPMLAIAWIFLLAGCKKDTFVEVDGVCPIILSTSPANGETGVLFGKTITATFNEPMNPSTITDASFTVKGGAPIEGVITFAGTTASFRPAALLTAHTTYYAKITTAVKDPSGNALQTAYTWTFSTDSLLAPIVISTVPANLSVGVPLNQVVTATFNLSMDPATLNASTFTLSQGSTPISGAVSLSDTTASFTPTANLVAGLQYTATITTGAKSLAGISLAANHVWTFTTGATIAPTVIATDPLNNETGVSQSKVLSATFSMPMNPATINSSTFTLRQGANVIAGTIAGSGANFTFTPTTPLLSGTTYTAIITTGAQSVGGVPLANNHAWNFTTIVIPGPTVISVDPANNAVGVPVAKVLVATFSEAMDPTTLNTSNFQLRQGANNIVGVVTFTSTTASFTPSSPLASGMIYTATITTGVKNLAGITMVNPYTWSFTTVAVPAPTVISTDPANNAVGVPLNKVLVATFSEPMDPTTLNATNFQLRQGINNIVGVVTFTSTTASFTPSSPLLSGLLYSATITTGVKNLAGVTMANPYIWTFTAIVVPPPTVILTDPLNLATNVPLNKVVTATFSVPMNPATINNTTFTLKRGSINVPGTVTYNGVMASFTPTANLQSDTTYTATITTGAQNPSGIGLVSNYVWTFNTVPHLGPNGVDLGSAGRFGILAGVGISNMAGFSEIRNMDVGIYPGARSSIVGFPPAIVVNGAIYAADDIAPPGVPAMLLQAKNDLTAAYLFAEAQTLPAPATVSGDLGGLTLAPGIYKSTSTLLIQSGDLTLDAQGDINAVWIFQIASGFTTVGGAGGSVILAGGASAANVYWQTGSSATVGDYTSFKGNILALTSVTMNSYSTAVGRMLCRNGAIVLTSTNIINRP